MSAIDGGTSSLGPGMRSSSKQHSSGQYPHPFFAPSSAYMPPSYKELFRWCAYLYTTHSEVAPVINKMASYVVTELVYECESAQSTKSWKELLERYLKIRDFETKLVLDQRVYGNAFASVYYPFERQFTCKSCDDTFAAKSVKWQYKDHKFKAQCEKCGGRMVNVKAKDVYVRNRSRIKLIRWNPQYIAIDHNRFSGRSVYTYMIPKHERAKIADATHDRNKEVVSDTPISILNAIRENSNFKIHADNIFHLKNESISADDDAFGMPPLLAVFKDAWLHQTYRRAQEQIALDHILPMTLLTPSPTAGGTSPHMSVELADWSNNMQRIVKRWRRDQNGIFTMPFPAQVQQIRGDAQALNVHNDMTQLRQQIVGGLDLPHDLLFGGLNYSGSSVSLRILENQFINLKSQLDAFLADFVIPKLKSFCDLGGIEVRHRDFKMADDAQQKQIALSLRQTNTISDRTTIEELGFDYEMEKSRRVIEEQERLDTMERQQRRQAEIQAEGVVLQSRAQARGEAEARRVAEQESIQSAQEGYQQTGSQTEMSPQALVTGKMEEFKFGDPGLRDQAAEHFLKSFSPQEQSEVLARMETSNPQLARAIRQRQAAIQKGTNSIQPLPEQRPPRRANSPL